MNLSVNTTQRHAKMRAHTATHLLHALLQHFIPTTQQAGSLVDDDYIRFDYTSDDMLTADQITQINEQINHIIAQGLSVTSTQMSYNDAIATGAKAFFQDKYGDVVRVVQVHNMDHLTSIELCGGTHVDNTSDIGAFVIVEQSPVASGTKRIVAYTGPKSYKYSHQLEQSLSTIASKLDCTPKQIDERLSKVLKSYEFLKQESKDFRTSVVNLRMDRFKSQMEENKKEDYLVISLIQDVNDNKNVFSLLYLNEAVEFFKEKQLKCIIYNKEGGYAIIGGNAKAFAQSHGLRGGGNNNLFQGKDEKIFNI